MRPLHADSHEQTFDEAICLAVAEKLISESPGADPHHSEWSREIETGELLKNEPEDFGEQPVEKAVFFLLADAEDEVVAVAFLDLVDEVDDLIGRVLQVRVHVEQVVALCIREAGGDGGLLAVIVRELDEPDAVVGLDGLLDQLDRAVPAAVVDEHDLVIEAVLLLTRLSTQQ